MDTLEWWVRTSTIFIFMEYFQEVWMCMMSSLSNFMKYFQSIHATITCLHIKYFSYFEWNPYVINTDFYLVLLRLKIVKLADTMWGLHQFSTTVQLKYLHIITKNGYLIRGFVRKANKKIIICTLIAWLKLSQVS